MKKNDFALLLILIPGLGSAQVAIECKGTLYVHPTDNIREMIWSDPPMHRDCNAYSPSDGQSNSNNISEAYLKSGKTHFGFYICDTSTAFGFDDWYLPSKNELNAIYENRDAIGGFTTNFYWSSTESSETDAWRQNFYDGKKDAAHKFEKGEIRCVRRD